MAEIQGRPRLEKPPLPRWSIAALMKVTGRRDEQTVRLPGAVAGVLTVALIYVFGWRAGGRELALASALVLCSLGFFVGEMRQASNDGPLAFFTALALYAAWRGSRLAVLRCRAGLEYRNPANRQNILPRSAGAFCSMVRSVWAFSPRAR